MSDHVAKRARMEGLNVDEVQRESTPPKKGLCNLGTQKFSQIVDVEAFVDKTLFIKEFLETLDKVIATLAPRRFGKSTLMDMVVEFVSGNKKLFQDNNLKIWNEERVLFDKYCQENPVIRLDFTYINGTTLDDILETLKKLISNAFRAHRYLIKVVEGKYSWSDAKMEEVVAIEKFQQYWAKPDTLTQSDIIDGLEELSHLLHVYHGKPVYVFIDEYDLPIMGLIVYSRLGEKDVNKIITIIDDLMSKLFKNNVHVKRGLIMACVRIADVLSGDANNIEYFEFLKSPVFSRYFGFTAEEVDSLLNKDEFIPFKNDQVKEWYNGYTLTNSEDHLAIYSSFSVLKYLWRSKDMNEPCFERYWEGTKSIVFLEDLFAENQIRELIQRLINKEEVEITTITRFEKKHLLTLQDLVHRKPKKVDIDEAYLFVQFLAENGYLNVVSHDVEKRTSIIRSPNMEINKLLRGKCYNAELFTKNKDNLSSKNTKNYLDALKSLLKKRDKKAFIVFAKAVSQLFDGAVTPQNRVDFHCILFALAYNLREFVVHSELGAQHQKPRGKPTTLDMLVILESVGMIIEINFEYESSKAAHKQIIEKGYVTAFNNYKDVKVKILMGLHVTSERKISLTYSIDGSPEETVTSEMTV